MFFVLLHDPTPILFHPHLGVFPLDQFAHFGGQYVHVAKLFSREIIIEVFQPV